MDDNVKAILRRLISEHNNEVPDDTSKFKSLMLDFCLGSNRLEIKILADALDEKVPQQLRYSGSTLLTDELMKRLSHQLEKAGALTPDAARWAVNTWTIALGMVIGEDTRASMPTVPGSNISYTVVSGTYVKDHAWHELRPLGYPNWLENLLPLLSSGKTVDDGVFEFSFNLSNKYYEIRLKNDYSQKQYDNYSSKLVDNVQRVTFNSWIEDHYWHPLYYEQMNPWLQKRVRELDKGNIICAYIFEYRRNPSAKQYEISVQNEKPLPQLYKRL